MNPANKDARTRRCTCRKAEATINLWGSYYLCVDCARAMGPTGERAIELHEARLASFTPEALQRIADGKIMDSNEIFLPAGKISLAEAKAREAAGVERII